MTTAKKVSPILGTEERLRAALQVKTTENPYAKPSISELCRLAGVSRATLYQHHKALLVELRPTRSESNDAKSEPKNIQTRRNNVDIQVKALLYLTLELQMEVNSLRALVPMPSKIIKDRK